MKMAWRDLFIYSFISPSTSSCPCQIALWKVPDTVGLGKMETPLPITHKNTHSAKNILSNQHQRLFFSLSIFHWSFRPDVYKSAKCPFQAARKYLIDHQTCQHVQLPTVRKWWMSEWMGEYSLPDERGGFQVKVSKKGKCKCYILVWPNNLTKCVLEKHYSTL